MLLPQNLKGTMEGLEFVPNPEEGCCINHGVEIMQCTVIAFVDELVIVYVVIVYDEVTIAGVITALKATYHDAQEHMGVNHLYLGMSLDVGSRGVLYHYAYVNYCDVRGR